MVWGLRKRRLAWAATVAVAILAVTAPASMAASGDGSDEGFAGAFRLQASNGYSILGLVSRQPEEKRGDLVLFVGNRGSRALYYTRATVTESVLRADLGAVGKVDLTLVPSGVKEQARSACEKRPVSYEGAIYEGTFEFHGEEGFTDLSATRTPLLIKPLLESACWATMVGESFGPGLPGARLRLWGGHGKRRFAVQFNKNAPTKGTHFSAELHEVTGDLDITRFVEGDAPSGAFQYRSDIGSATVGPPAPFTGSATFMPAVSGANRWRGNLTIDFPGRSDFSLMGAVSRISLLHARRIQETIHPPLDPSLLAAPFPPATASAGTLAG